MYTRLLATLTMQLQERWKAAKGKGQSWLVPVSSLMPIMIWPTQWSSPLLSSSPVPTLTSADSCADTKQNKKRTKKWAGDWKINCASTGLVLGSKRNGFYTDVLSDFKRTGWLFSWHGWHKPSKKKIHERQWGSCQAESSPTTRPWSTKRETFLFMWNYGRDTGNQLAASKSKNLSWWRESKFVYK